MKVELNDNGEIKDISLLIRQSISEIVNGVNKLLNEPSDIHNFNELFYKGEKRIGFQYTITGEIGALTRIIFEKHNDFRFDDPDYYEKTFGPFIRGLCKLLDNLSIDYKTCNKGKNQIFVILMSVDDFTKIKQLNKSLYSEDQKVLTL